ncbi:MAG: rhodanese-like domain-containing protein [Betaproteobacteria bacterium]
MKNFPTQLRHVVATAALAFAAVALPLNALAITSADLPEPKRTHAGLYLEAKDVPSFIEQHGKNNVLFVDVRTRSEAMYVGMAAPVDALVPYVEHSEFMTDWDPKRHIYRLEPFQDFVPEMNRRLQAKGLSKDDPVILICRSGDRSSRGADRLAEDGFTHVYSVVDGFEGDMGKDGRRDVNGWKNAGLPWSYKLVQEKMYFPK